MRGALITFEGVEGCGKSTQLGTMATKIMETTGAKVRMLREPGGTPVGEDIRGVFKFGHQMQGLTEVLLVNASRCELVSQIIVPALNAGEIILCDRFYDSTIAYQGWGRRLDIEAVREIISFATGGLHPDLTIFLDVPLETSKARRKSRGASDRIEAESDEFFERVRKGFLSQLSLYPLRVRPVNGEGSEGEVSSRIWSIISAFLDHRGLLPKRALQ